MTLKGDLINTINPGSALDSSTGSARADRAWCVTLRLCGSPREVRALVVRHRAGGVTRPCGMVRFASATTTTLKLLQGVWKMASKEVGPVAHLRYSVAGDRPSNLLC